MDSLNLPPNEDWWERTLLTREKAARQSGERFGHRAARLGRTDIDSRAVPVVRPNAASAPREGQAATFRALEANDPEYASLAASAREFLHAVQRRNDWPPGCDLLAPPAARLVAHLAEGHALGHDDQVLCGYIVCCRWALADCRFCEKSLVHIVVRLAHPEFAGLLDRCRALASAIDEQIDRLRLRVWW